jgi:S1-C subfamily serine protease
MKNLICFLLVLPMTFGQTTLSTAQIAKKVSPSVVVIQGKTDSGDVLGTGFIVSKDGKIVTNLHVVRNMKTASIQLANGDVFDSLSVLATDERRDIAIVQIAGFDLPVLELGNSDVLTVGEPLVIVGSPRGLEGTVTAGILSSVRDSGEGFKVLQTDAAVNPGSSGGPLVNNKGQVIGVVSFRLRSAEGLNFAVPINYVRGLLSTLHEPTPLNKTQKPLAGTTSAVQQSRLRSYTKSPFAKERIKTPVEDFAMWVDQRKWKQVKPDTAGTFKFESIDGVGWAVVMTARNGMSTDELREFVLSNEQNTDPSVRITLEEKRIVNGREILALQTAGVNRGIPFKHFGYYYGGTSGTVQAIAYTIEAALDDNIEMFTEFLNGLEVSGRDFQTASDLTANLGVVSFNSNMSLKYDPKKWKQLQSKQEGHFTFSYSLGSGYAVISAEPLPIPTDSFPEVALANGKSTDPKAAIVFMEKRRVNGVLVWFIKTETTFNKNPMIYCGYYYGGKHNSVQILTYTTKELLPKYERDFIEFLNGFSASEEP